MPTPMPHARLGGNDGILMATAAAVPVGERLDAAAAAALAVVVGNGEAFAPLEPVLVLVPPLVLGLVVLMPGEAACR